jgi:hypothetical protein
MQLILILWKDINLSNQTKTPEDRALQTVNGAPEALVNYIVEMFLLKAKAKDDDT